MKSCGKTFRFKKGFGTREASFNRKSKRCEVWRIGCKITFPIKKLELQFAIGSSFIWKATDHEVQIILRKWDWLLWCYIRCHSVNLFNDNYHLLAIVKNRVDQRVFD